MIFNSHSDLEGKHAFLSASQSSWLNYDLEHLTSRWKNERAKQEGTELHALAEQLIRKKRKLRGNDTLSMYVNDAIGFHLEPEVLLFYSYNAFGTADAIRYDEKKHFLRIHDLKTGVTKVHMEQLMVYAALFCLEYNVKPTDIDIELRIYQNNEIQTCIPEAEDIIDIMDIIVTFDNHIDKLREEEGV